MITDTESIYRYIVSLFAFAVAVAVAAIIIVVDVFALCFSHVIERDTLN